MGLLGGILKDLISPVTDILGEVIVDKDKKNEINYKIQELIDKADQRYHEQMLGQIEVNKQEAQHASVFVAGWRPAIGWISAAGIGYTFVLAPFIEFIARAVFSYNGVMPMPDTGQLMALVTAMLGVAGLRSYDKKVGTGALPKNV